MKKTAIALTIAALAAATAAQAAPQANTFYVGTKAGWASFHDGLNRWDTKKSETGIVGIKRNSVTYGVFGGYQITDNFAVELGYDDFGRVKGNRVIEGDYAGSLNTKMTNHGTHLSLKASYPVIADLDVYARVGAALIRSDYKIKVATVKSPESTFKAHSLKVSPVFAGGVEYAILPELAARVEYQWVNGVGKLKAANGDRVDFTPSVGSVSAGLTYRFGQGAMVVPEVISKKFTLNSDVTFAFDKANLKPEAQGVLDGIYGEIAQLQSASVAVAGYTDRLGSDAYNLKLSQRRADTVANYLVSKGVAPQAISATGMGESSPVTGNKCDSVKGRKALIACLADDRRVEISVKGNK